MAGPSSAGVSSFPRQVAHIVFSDLTPALALQPEFFRDVHNALARELGVGRLVNGETYDAVCGGFLLQPYDLWNDSHGSADYFLKSRLSLVELLFRAIEERVARQAASARKPGLARILGREVGAPDAVAARAMVEQAITELNARMRAAGLEFHYHNGLLQFAQDGLIQSRLSEPCWALLRDAVWANAEIELKEAFHAADGRRADAAFHVAKALESVVKVISDQKGWTRGNENGASAYIDNLVSQQNGRFIAPWEAELLKAFFKHVRNPHGHGAGSQPPPAFNEKQTAWALESSMAWMKSLILRC
ncbi:hypothetical protein AAFN86_19690 [Roseomonas sp. CAU 1739]|uniref:hypothetical protein n=1 Tax=Roseomonas sp. CAU 1739 TaxID=3140364 RepID=UPI00325B6608